MASDQPGISGLDLMSSMASMGPVPEMGGFGIQEGLHALWESVFLKMEQEPEPMMRARGKSKEDKYCGVCGDRALGYNFDAISCESCKAFFRRNAPKGLEYFKCPYEEKCKMDVSNRRFCKRCRLKKCFEIGMRKEYILTEEERMKKRQKIEENRRVRELEKQGIVIKTENGDVTSTDYPMSPSRMLTMEEMMMIDEVTSAYNSSLEICVGSIQPRDITRTDYQDLVNVAEVSVRRVIDMSKKIKTFKSLPQATQMALLKGGSIELLILRSVLSYNKEKHAFLDASDNPSTSTMSEEELTRVGLFDEHMKFVKHLAVELKADETTLILLLMISLFSPDRPCLDFKEIVSFEQEKYAMLLKRYLESKYPIEHVRLLFPKLLMKLTDIRNLNEEHSQVLLKVNPQGIQPLMKEVLELKTPAERV